ncbi:endothelin-converting enzyme homolog [Penaeus indicus]|uniref:endothelin-converting enzyme homolog n=2 Tax=Penaeus TaxID=133894 RepID=UPI00300C1D84
MRELLDTMDEPQDVNSIEWKLKTFYWSCMNVHSYMKSGLDLIKRKIITELYGWNLIRDTWDLRRWEFDVVLTRLHAEFGVSPFFKVTVVPDPRREGHNIIKLLPSGFSLPHRSYYDRMPNNPLHKIFNQIRYTFANNLANSRWYPLEVKAQLTSKLNNMTLAVGYPNRLLDLGVINAYYEDYTIFIKDFFQNLQDSIRNAQRQLEMKLIEPMPESKWMDALSEESVSYIHEANKIVIPPHLLNPPLFHRNYPMAMLYGSLGVQIARAMLRAVDSVGLAWNSRGQLTSRSIYTNRSLDNLRGLADCIAAATMEVSRETDAVVKRTAYDTASEVDAVRQTYQAYVSLMHHQPQPQHPSFENFNTTNIFFMAYAGSLCSDMTAEEKDIHRTCYSSLIDKPKLEAVLTQLPEFSKDFSCPKDSYHFPKRLCAQFH